MKDAKGVTAAITAAVAAYLGEESATHSPNQTAQMAAACRAWTNYGRDELMRNRTLWQLRMAPMSRGK